MTIISDDGARLGSALLCLLLTCPVQSSSQQTSPLPARLDIVVVEGEGAINNVSQRVTREPVVQVEDESHKPVVGAAVVFTLPTEGATGQFADGSKTFTVLTDDSGRAAARGLRFNQFPGKVPMHVSASYKGLAARIIVNMETVLPPGAKPPSAKSSGSGKWIVILAIAGAAAGGGAYFALHKSNSPAPPTTPTGPNPIGITAGTGTIVGGH